MDSGKCYILSGGCQGLYEKCYLDSLEGSMDALETGEYQRLSGLLESTTDYMLESQRLFLSVLERLWRVLETPNVESTGDALESARDPLETGECQRLCRVLVTLWNVLDTLRVCQRLAESARNSLEYKRFFGECYKLWGVGTKDSLESARDYMDSRLHHFPSKLQADIEPCTKISLVLSNYRKPEMPIFGNYYQSSMVV